MRGDFRCFACAPAPNFETEDEPAYRGRRAAERVSGARVDVDLLHEDVPPCRMCGGVMERDYSGGCAKIDFQEKGVFPYNDIQSGKTYYSYKEFVADKEKGGWRHIERSEASDRNRERMNHRKVF